MPPSSPKQRNCAPRVKEFGQHLRRRTRSLPFRMLDLPAELRNQIYLFYIINESFRKGYRPTHVGSAAITLVCKQVRSEVSDLYYSKRTFKAMYRVPGSEEWRPIESRTFIDAVLHEKHYIFVDPVTSLEDARDLANEKYKELDRRDRPWLACDARFRRFMMRSGMPAAEYEPYGVRTVGILELAPDEADLACMFVFKEPLLEELK